LPFIGEAPAGIIGVVVVVINNDGGVDTLLGLLLLLVLLLDIIGGGNIDDDNGALEEEEEGAIDDIDDDDDDDDWFAVDVIDGEFIDDNVGDVAEPVALVLIVVATAGDADARHSASERVLGWSLLTRATPNTCSGISSSAWAYCH
jgi:hypothetical protein